MVVDMVSGEFISVGPKGKQIGGTHKMRIYRRNTFLLSMLSDTKKKHWGHVPSRILGVEEVTFLNGDIDPNAMRAVDEVYDSEEQ